MSIENRVAKLELIHGANAGPCPMCEARTRAAEEPPRTFGPEWEVTPFTTVNIECPRCGRPFPVTVELVGRREAA